MERPPQDQDTCGLQEILKPFSQLPVEKVFRQRQSREDSILDKPRSIWKMKSSLHSWAFLKANMFVFLAGKRTSSRQKRGSLAKVNNNFLFHRCFRSFSSFSSFLSFFSLFFKK